MYNYVPDPPHTKKDHPPQVGQASVYVAQDGSRYPGMIDIVEGKLPNGNWQVVMRILKPSASQLVKDPSKLGERTAEERNGWQYNPEYGEVYWCPCVPTDPSIKCPHP